MKTKMVLKKLFIFQLIILGFIVGCQNNGEGDKTTSDETDFEFKTGQDLPTQGGSQPPSLGSEFVTCSNVEIFNDQLEKISKLGTKCSFASLVKDSLRPYVEVKRLKEPTSAIDALMLTLTGGSEGTFVPHYNNDDLRRDDPANLFFGVKVSGSCEKSYFKNSLTHGHSNYVYLGGHLSVYTAPYNRSFSSTVYSHGSECLSLMIDRTGSLITLKDSTNEVFKQLPMTSEDSQTVYNFEIYGKKWKIRSNQDFQSCSAGPSFLSLYGGLEASIGTSSNGSKSVSFMHNMMMDLYRFKPSPAYINSISSSHFRNYVKLERDLHAFSCMGQKNNFSW